MQRHDWYLVRKPESPQHGHSDALLLIFGFYIEHVDVETIAQRVNAVIHIPDGLAGDFNAVDEVDARKYEIAGKGFAALIHQVHAPCPLIQVFFRTSMKR